MPSRSTNENYANVPDRPTPVSALNRVLPGINDKPATAAAEREATAASIGSGPTGELTARAGTNPVASPTPGAAADVKASKPAPKRKR